MIGKSLVILAVTVLAGFGYCTLISKAYPFVLASPEARESLEVSDAQRAELNAAQHKSDVIAYGIFGAVLCAVVAAVGFHPVEPKHRAISVFAGIVVGVISGMAMGLLGYAFFKAMDPIINDPMVHVFSRLAVMFIPVALAVGITVACGAKSKAEMSKATVGAIIGSLLTALIFGITAGLATPLEVVAAIFPAHPENRYLLFLTAFATIGTVSFLQVNRSAKAVIEPTGEHSPE